MDPFRPLLRLLAPLLTHRHWPRVRAALIAAHVFCVFVVACPAPVIVPGKAQWERASVKSEVRNWQRRLALVGVKASEREITDLMTKVVKSWSATRNSAVKPFSGYLKAIGAPQGWYMFTGPDRSPQRMTVEIIDGHDQRVHVFTMGEAVARPDLVDPGLLGEHRVRRAMFQAAWSERKSLFRDVCRWFGRHVALKLPDSKEVICTLTEKMVDHPWNDLPLDPPKVKKTARYPLQPDAPGAESAAKPIERKNKAEAAAEADNDAVSP